MTRRHYRNPIRFVEQAFRACGRNASDLTTSAQGLLKDHHATSLGLTILAIEELGKLCVASGLISAKPGDPKSLYFDKSMRDHAVKLRAFETFPIFIRVVASLDPRIDTEEAYGRTIRICLQQLKQAGNDLLENLGSATFASLDNWKQKSFYAMLEKGALVAPHDLVPLDLAVGAYRLASCAVSTLDFVFKGGNLERYFEMAKISRKKLTEEQQTAIENAADELISHWFDTEDPEKIAPRTTTH